LVCSGVSPLGAVSCWSAIFHLRLHGLP
jgi:hypothetical protein